MQTTPMVACDTNGHTYSRLAFTAQRGECAATVQMHSRTSILKFEGRNSPDAKAFVLCWASRHLECSFEDVGVKGTRQVPIWEGTKKLKKSKFDQIRPANVERGF